MAATVLFFYGEDTYRSAQKLAALKSRYIDKSLGDTNLTVLHAAQLSFEEWVRQVQAFPFLATSRLVIVRNLLLEGKKELHDRIFDYLAKIPSSTVIVFYEAGQPDQRTKLFKKLNQAKSAEHFAPLVGPARRRWIEAQLADVAAEPALINWLASQPVTLWQLANDLEKMALFATELGRPLTLADGQEFVATSQTSDAFRLIEAVASGETGKALSELRVLLEAGEAELYLLSMIAYQYRTLLLIAEAAVDSRQAGAIARATKLSPYVVEKGLRIVGRRPPEDFVRGLTQILEYDRQIKVGEVDPRLGLELLISELAEQ